MSDVIDIDVELNVEYVGDCCPVVSKVSCSVLSVGQEERERTGGE